MVTAPPPFITCTGSRVTLVPVVGIELTTYRLQGGCSTTELNRQNYGGGDKDRTCYILLAKQALSQMSYTPNYMAPQPGLEPGTN